MQYSRRFISLVIVVGLFGLILLAQDEADDDVPILQITVSGETCAMVILESEEIEATPEPEETPEPEMTPELDNTSEPDYPIITLSEDCEDLIPLLLNAKNGTIWIALAVPDEEEWQQFEPYEEDDYPPQFDGRGRFVGCSIPQEGEQICHAIWELDEIVYLLEIPIFVGDAYITPSNDVVSTQESNQSSIGWGACGSCDSCGTDASLCVLNPEGICLADPEGCGTGSTNDTSSDSPSSPATTEEP